MMTIKTKLSTAFEQSAKCFYETQIYQQWARTGLNPGKPLFTNKLKEIWGRSTSNNPKIRISAQLRQHTLRRKYTAGQFKGLNHACLVYNKAHLYFTTLEQYI